MAHPILLRPTSVGDLLDEAIRLYCHNCISFVGVPVLLGIIGGLAGRMESRR